LAAWILLGRPPAPEVGLREGRFRAFSTAAEPVAPAGVGQSIYALDSGYHGS
jgi:hypothetical protein